MLIKRGGRIYLLQKGQKDSGSGHAGGPTAPRAEPGPEKSRDPLPAPQPLTHLLPTFPRGTDSFHLVLADPHISPRGPLPSPLCGPGNLSTEGRVLGQRPELTPSVLKGTRESSVLWKPVSRSVV